MLKTELLPEKNSIKQDILDRGFQLLNDSIDNVIHLDIH